MSSTSRNALIGLLQPGLDPVEDIHPIPLKYRSIMIDKKIRIAPSDIKNIFFMIIVFLSKNESLIILPILKQEF